MIPRFWLDPCHKLLVSDFRVAIAIFSHGGPNGCFPKTKAIAQMTGLERKTVTRSIARLQKKGLIRVIERPGTSHLYEMVGTYGMSQPTPVNGVQKVPTVGTYGKSQGLGHAHAQNGTRVYNLVDTLKDTGKKTGREEPTKTGMERAAKIRAFLASGGKRLA